MPLSRKKMKIQFHYLPKKRKMRKKSKEKLERLIDDKYKHIEETSLCSIFIFAILCTKMFDEVILQVFVGIDVAE
jgi:hypothetical protein